MTRLIPAFIIGALLLIPLGLLPFRSDHVSTFIREMEKREPEPLPAFDSFEHLTSQSRYKKLGRYLADHYPLRDVVIPRLATFNHKILKKPHMNGVDWGKNGWAFLHSSLHLRHESPEAAADTMEKLQTALVTFTTTYTPEELAKILIVVAPDKETIYREELSEHSLRTYERFRPARERFHELITQTNGLQTIDFWEIYRGLKEKWDRPVYLKYDTHHTAEAAGHMVLTIVNHLNGKPLWTKPPYSATSGSRTISPDLALVAGLNDFTETVPNISHAARSPRTYSARRLDGSDLDPSNHSDWLSTRNDAVRARTAPREGQLVKGKTLFIHDSFLAVHRRTLASAFQDVTFRHRNELTACLLRDALHEYDRIVIEFAERRAIVREGFPLVFGACTDSRIEDLELEAIKKAPLRGSAASCQPGINASWRISGWVVAGNPYQEVDEVLILDTATTELVPTKAIWEKRPDVQQLTGLGEARFKDIGFTIDARYLPKNFRLFARVDEQLYEMRTGKRCQDTLSRVRPEQ